MGVIVQQTSPVVLQTFVGVRILLFSEVYIAAVLAARRILLRINIIIQLSSFAFVKLSRKQPIVCCDRRHGCLDDYYRVTSYRID